MVFYSRILRRTNTAPRNARRPSVAPGGSGLGGRIPREPSASPEASRESPVAPYFSLPTSNLLLPTSCFQLPSSSLLLPTSCFQFQRLSKLVHIDTIDVLTHFPCDGQGLLSFYASKTASQRAQALPASHVPPPISDFLLLISYFLLPRSSFQLPASYFVLPTSRFPEGWPVFRRRRHQSGHPMVPC